MTSLINLKTSLVNIKKKSKRFVEFTMDSLTNHNSLDQLFVFFPLIFETNFPIMPLQIKWDFWHTNHFK
jgi:hypothetical protein